MEMDERKIRILQAIISDYISTAEPVGSRTIAKKYDLGISSATIRNEMADLEDMGYIEQLHSSSGRKPSNKGYRLYVDKLMQKTELSPEEELIIKNQVINAALFEVDKIVRQATQLLSELTKFTCIVKAPSFEKSYIKAIQLVPIDSSNVLSVIITESGLLKNNVIHTTKNISANDLRKITKILDLRLKNLTIEEINLIVINDLKKDLEGHEDIFNAIIPALYESLNNSPSDDDIYLEGASNIFNYPEFKDIDKAREFLLLMDDKENLRSLLRNNSDISISIGEENYLQEAKDCSVITSVYKIGDRPIGSIGVIGPTRMPYSKVIMLLTNVVREINESLTNNFFDDR